MSALPLPARRGAVVAAGLLALAAAVVPFTAHGGAAPQGGPPGGAPPAALAALASTPAPEQIGAPPGAGGPAVPGPLPLDQTMEQARAQLRRFADAARARAGDQRTTPTLAVPPPAVTQAGGAAAVSDRPGASVALARPTVRLFVSPRGDDGNAGTEAAPVRSLAQAARLARPGTQVVVGAGTYSGTVTTGVSGTASARVAFVSATRGAAKIVGSGGGDAAWLNTGSYVDIVGFDIGGPNEDGLMSEGSFVRLVDNRVHDFRGGNCITTANDGYNLHDIDVIGNVTSGCGSGTLDHGIYVSHVRGKIANNISFANAGVGIHCWHACNAMTISNNLVFDNAQDGILIGQGDGPNNGSVAADDFVVSNNIAVDNGRDGIRETGATGSGNRFLNNLLWNNKSANINLNTGSQTGTMVTDPGLRDLRPDGTGNYRPRPGSPALGSGVHLGAPSTDIDGRARPADGRVDIGVYQR